LSDTSQKSTIAVPATAGCSSASDAAVSSETASGLTIPPRPEPPAKTGDPLEDKIQECIEHMREQDDYEMACSLEFARLWYKRYPELVTAPFIHERWLEAMSAQDRTWGDIELNDFPMREDYEDHLRKMALMCVQRFPELRSR
jgi:hypothetical protein